MQEDKFIVPQRKPTVGKSPVVSVQQPDNMSAKLQDVAFKAGRFRSEHIQMCIYYAMAQLQITEEKEEILILENENRTRSLEEDCHYNFWI